MTATGSTENATGVRLNVEVFDVQCGKRGAYTDAARGELVDADRTTVWRWRTGRQQPSLETVARIAERFGCAVEDLIERGS